MAWRGLPDDPILPVVHLLEEGEELRAFHGIKLDEPTLEDFKSAFTRGHPPPRGIQKRSAAVWMAVSMTTTREATESRIAFFPKIGTHVAEVLMAGGRGFSYAITLEEAHYSVWGDPLKLANSVVDVYPVG